MKLPGSTQDPLWYKDAIIYETHVKAFFDSNNDGIGDFAGLFQKLDYLQELGITCIWLLPFYPSPLRDDGYDISGYTSIHPSYGTLEDFKVFLRAAHERDIQVVTELVVNHTSDQNPWFQAARKAPPGSPEREFYVWSDTDQKYRDARIIFTDTEKSNWAWDSEAQAYYWHRFFSHQPDLNYDNPRVLDEVLNVMRFWLDLGVDGLRLDAVPYLVEREGTSCENLRETHTILKRIRRELDGQYANRFLLAEANQWPSDVRPYFGDGDECHMAFHFPLMPRIFMALRLEDRHPITDIMAQTPGIPEICQWGLFLRNHDELTLEMVTEDERDYMYLAYSADPKMRLNLGIRRRLAPLMDNNPYRIQLLNSLLFSFPGTPIIYYGDEIGMGDNIYLGDRNGVRTPMQWSGDRNAGFSRANPAVLYSPVIMDPVYGYEAINVEAQQSNPSSMLYWMRNMIALRKLFKVFGRGTIEFFHPANRKVLAYLRRYESDRVLCVANLSRFPQPVELDLSALAGMTPVEMLGYAEFPAIRREPYPLTLGPYGFYWFELQGAPEPIEVQPVEAETGAGTALTVTLAGAWESLFNGPHKATLETRLLPEFLPRQRWFGAKAGNIASTRILDWTPLSEEGALSALVTVEVDYAGDPADEYFVPLALSFGVAAQAIQKDLPECVLGPVTADGAEGILHDATVQQEACRILLESIERSGEWRTRRGKIRAFRTAAFAEARGPGEGPLAVTRGSAEQSNTSVRYGGRLILKLFRRLEPGPNPDFEISRYLTERGFPRVPPLAGAIEYDREGQEPATLAMLQPLIENQGDGWEWTLEELGRYYESSAARRGPSEQALANDKSLLELSDSEAPDAVRETIGLYFDAAATLGKRTGEMHLALGSPASDPAFEPEPVTPGDLGVLSRELREHAEQVFNTLRENLVHLPDDILGQAGLVLSQRRALVARFRDLEHREVNAGKIRIHGDFHLGQVLCVKNDYFILDFEGEPARPLAERRTKHPALSDVAGMLRSFSYAAFAGLMNHTARRPEDYRQLEPWAGLWERWVSASYLKSYRSATAGAAFLPGEVSGFETLLDVYLLDKALYELRYELNNRPSWVRIPLHGILSLARQEASE